MDSGFPEITGLARSIAMDASADLKLVRDEDTTGDTIPFDRRHADRRSISGRVTALRSTADNPESRNRICPLELLNISQTGIGAISQEPIEDGVSIVVFIPPHGNEQGQDLYGKVIRSHERDEYGYEVGIALDESFAMTRSAS